MKILIVDNDASTVTTLSALLGSREKFTIEAAYGGEEGLAKMKADPGYDLVLLDIMMPKVSGMDVCQEMVKDWRLREIPVLLMSSALPIPPEEFHQSLEKYSALSVVKGVIEKPFVLDDLLKKIHETARRPL